MNVIKQRRPKQKIEKSNEEFKEHERVIMDKRIAEINNVITKKCHSIWNQHLYFQKKPNTLQFNFVYHGLENYLKKCDDYKPEQHKDNKQKWWNNQKASEMSQQFLPSVLNSTDQMAQYIGKQIQPNLQLEFTNYVTFELVETAITSVFSTQRSGSNEVFLRTSFQYAKAGLRKKLVSYFGDGELRIYDTKSRKKKDLWQRLIKDKKDKLLQIFQHKQSMYSNDTKIGIINNNDYNNNNNNNGYEYNMYPPSTQQQQQQQQQIDNNNVYNNNNIWKNEQQQYNNNEQNVYNCNNNNNNNNNVNIMDLNNTMNHINNGTLPFPQPLLMDITLTYPNTNNMNSFDTYQTQQTQQPIPPQIQTKTKYSMNTNRNSMMINNNNNTNNQCRQCLQYMSKMSELLKVNSDLNRDSLEIKQLNIKYSAERDHWKSQYQQLLQQYQQLLRQNNELLQENKDNKQQQQINNINNITQPPPLSPQNMVDIDEDDDEDDDDGDDDIDNNNNNNIKNNNIANINNKKYTPSFSNMSNMSVSSKTNGNNKNNKNNKLILSPSSNNNNQQQIPLDDICKTPKDLQPFNINGFSICDNSSITPYSNIESINGFPFPTHNTNTIINNNNNDNDNIQKNGNNNDNNNDDNNNGKCTVSVAASVMSVCSNEHNNNNNNNPYLQQQSIFNNNNWTMQ